MLKVTFKLTIFFLCFLCLIQPIGALTEIKIRDDYIEFQSLITLNQNVTLIKHFEYNVNEGLLQIFNESLTQAIKTQAPSAKIYNLKASVRVNENWFNVSLSFKVNGVAENIGNKILINCSWKSFQVKNSLVINDVELNKFGESYLTPLIKKYENSSEARFWINKTYSVSPEKALEVAKNFLILDFKEFSKPLEKWNKTYNVKSQTTIFQYDVPSKINFNLTIMDVEKNQTKFYIAKLDSKAIIYVPGYAKANEDILIFNDIKKGGVEKNVTSIILTLIIAIICIHFYERKTIKI
ncbi:MAG: hypothetical protein QXN41_00770 [Candidatus Bathyarchaeia archaeon]